MSDLEQYAQKLPPIYQDLLRQFPDSDPYRTPGSGLAVPTIYTGLREKYREENREFPYSNGMVVEAFRQMAQSGVVELRNDIFVYPQSVGEELIAILSGQSPATIPPFPALPTMVHSAAPAGEVPQ